MTSGEELLEIKKVYRNEQTANLLSISRYRIELYRTGNLEIEECHTIFFVLWFTK